MYEQFRCHFLIPEVRALKPHIDIEPDRRFVNRLDETLNGCNPGWR